MFQVNNVSYRYPRNRDDTIRNLNFEMRQGEIFGLLGPSGVGKSTTQKIMVRLLTDYRGTINYRNRDLKTFDKDYYQEIGVGFEVPVHFSKLTAEENINFFSKLYKNHIDTDSLMKRLGIYDERKKKVSEFSKGMKIRLNFVRAVMNNPVMLFLDEPTIGLDPANARILKNLIKEYRDNGGTVLLSTHLMNDVDELCDRVAFMVDGSIKEIDTPQSLKLKHGENKVVLEFMDSSVIAKATFEMDTLSSNSDFFNIIKTKKIISMHSKETTLDDIFIKVTGVGKNA
ncbi:MAG: ABC transporter ATP-binding protein [Bacillota bacterium]|nr:ABC transporter ATP-binding protein [Bacillota bacterium]